MTRIHIGYSDGQFWWGKCFDPDCQADRHSTLSRGQYLVFWLHARISGYVQEVLRGLDNERW